MIQIPHADEVIARVLYGRVLSQDTREFGGAVPETVVMDLDKGTIFKLQGRKLILSFRSSSQFLGEEEVTRAQMGTLLENAGWEPFTLELATRVGRLWQPIRRVVGVLVGPQSMQGWSMVRDLEVPVEESLSQSVVLVEHQTIRSLILRETRYMCKPWKGVSE